MTHSSTGDIFKGTNFASAYLGNAKFPGSSQYAKRLGGKEIGTPAGGILSTIQDLHTWNNSLYVRKILKPETLTVYGQKRGKTSCYFWKNGLCLWNYAQYWQAQFLFSQWICEGISFL
jgi:hypothetical protein